MRIRYTPPSHLELAASEHELHQLSRSLTEEGVRQFRGEQEVTSAPYQMVLAAVQITPTNGPAEVTVREKEVWITGSSKNLDRLASFFEAAAESGHAHFEWFTGNEFVSETSVPLVIACEPERS
jgi:hypothetical protein